MKTTIQLDKPLVILVAEHTLQSLLRRCCDLNSAQFQLQNEILLSR